MLLPGQGELSSTTTTVPAVDMYGLKGFLPAFTGADGNFFAVRSYASRSMGAGSIMTAGHLSSNALKHYQRLMSHPAVLPILAQVVASTTEVTPGAVAMGAVTSESEAAASPTALVFPMLHLDSLADIDLSTYSLASRVKLAIIIGHDLADLVAFAHRQTPSVSLGGFELDAVLLRRSVGDVLNTSKETVGDHGPAIYLSGFEARMQCEDEMPRLRGSYEHASQMHVRDVRAVGRIVLRVLCGSTHVTVQPGAELKQLDGLRRHVAAEPEETQQLFNLLNRFLTDCHTQSFDQLGLDIHAAFVAMQAHLFGDTSATLQAMMAAMPSFKTVKQAVASYCDCKVHELDAHLAGLSMHALHTLSQEFVSRQVRQAATASTAAGLVGAIPGIGTIAQLGIVLGTVAAELVLQSRQFGYMVMGAGIIRGRVKSDAAGRSLLSNVLGLYSNCFTIEKQRGQGSPQSESGPSHGNSDAWACLLGQMGMSRDPETYRRPMEEVAFIAQEFASSLQPSWQRCASNATQGSNRLPGDDSDAFKTARALANAQASATAIGRAFSDAGANVAARAAFQASTGAATKAATKAAAKAAAKAAVRGAADAGTVPVQLQGLLQLEWVKNMRSGLQQPPCCKLQKSVRLGAPFS